MNLDTTRLYTYQSRALHIQFTDKGYGFYLLYEILFLQCDQHGLSWGVGVRSSHFIRTSMHYRSQIDSNQH